MDENIKIKLDYCLNCKTKPCSNKGCPLNNDIPTVIKLMKEEKFEEAYEELTKTTVLPSVCGRICPHERQCQGSCVRGIKGSSVNIGDIETYLGDMAIQKDFKIKKFENLDLAGVNIAVVGGGPAGLTASAFLARRGANVTIYEKYGYLGGLLVHGIPDFRLSKDIVKKSIDKILELGITVKYNQSLGKDIMLDNLEKEYDKVILAIGANVSIKLEIEGEELNGVYGGNELLEYKLHPNYKGKTVVVYGGGNVAIDVARTAKKLGAEKVIIAYRRDKEQMPADRKEVEEAENEGIEFLLKCAITQVLGDYDKNVTEIEMIKTELVQKPGEARLSPIKIPGSEHKIKTDIVVMALGSKVEKMVESLDISMNSRNKIETDNEGQTSKTNVYAIGDLAGKIGTVAWASESGKRTAISILR